MSEYVGLKRGKVHDEHVSSEYYCGGCGGPVTDHDSYCPECGGAFQESFATELTCKLEPLEAFYVTVNMLDQTEWGVCSNCGTASPIDATYCCECGRKVER